MPKFDPILILQEIATRDNAEWSQFFGLLPDPDPVLKKLVDGGGRILEELTADGHLASVIATRHSATLAKDYHWQPGRLEQKEPAPDAVKLVNWLAEDLERIDMPGLVAQIINAPLYGYTPIELIWERGDGRMRLKDLRALPPGWFGFDSQTSEPRFLAKDNPWEGVPLPFAKFVLARHGATYDNPYGLRLLSRCFWPVTFKKGGVKFWIEFVEKFGGAFLTATYAPGTSEEEQRKLLQALINMRQNAVAVMPDGAKVEILSAGGSGADKIHETLKSAMDAEVSKVIGGQTLTSEVGDTGSYAAAKTHAGILELLQDADARLIKTTLEEISWIYTEINSPGTISPLLEWREEEDLQPKRTARDKDLSQVLQQSGLKLSRAYLIKAYNLDEDDLEEVPAANFAPPQFWDSGTIPAKTRSAFFREPWNDNEIENTRAIQGQAQLDEFCAALVERNGEALAGNEDSLLAIVAGAKSYDELMAGLLEAYPDLDSQKLADSLEGGILQASLLGRMIAGGRGKANG
ncbi:MAG: DUF935 domain-containing protein [Desulfarculales bacterium]|jgi:phage gp29-like protein|nr:DUF935 domain-containing protein [Desulfarculales bacterium]